MELGSLREKCKEYVEIAAKLGIEGDKEKKTVRFHDIQEKSYTENQAKEILQKENPIEDSIDGYKPKSALKPAPP